MYKLIFILLLPMTGYSQQVTEFHINLKKSPEHEVKIQFPDAINLTYVEFDQWIDEYVSISFNNASEAQIISSGQPQQLFLIDSNIKVQSIKIHYSTTNDVWLRFSLKK